MIETVGVCAGNHTLIGLYDLPLLVHELYLRGYKVRGLAHPGHWATPLGPLFQSLGAVKASPMAAYRLQDAEAVLLFPGGGREVNAASTLFPPLPRPLLLPPSLYPCSLSPLPPASPTWPACPGILYHIHLHCMTNKLAFLPLLSFFLFCLALSAHWGRRRSAFASDTDVYAALLWVF